MAETPKIDITSIDGAVIQELANAISRSMAEYTTDLGARARQSTGPGGLGGEVNYVTKQAQEAAQRNIRGFSGGTVSGLAGQIFNPPTQEDLARNYRGQGSKWLLSDEAKKQMQREALGLDPNPAYPVDPRLFGGQMSMGQYMRIGASAINAGAGDQFDPSFVQRTSAAALLNKGAAYAPMMTSAGQRVQQAYRYGQGLTALGAMQGVSAGGSDITIPGTNIGFRPPWNQAAIVGGMTKVNQALMASRAGINLGQASDINTALISQGYNFGNSRTGALQNMYADIIGSNQALDRPETYNLGNLATRYAPDANKAMKDFANTMRQLPAAAADANLSLAQVSSSLQMYVTSDVHRGGTAQQSAPAYMQQLRQTGIDPTSLAVLNKNPFTQAAYRREGLKPWQIAGATGTQKTTAQMQGMSDMFRMYGGGADPNSAQGQEAIQKMMYYNPELQGMTTMQIQQLIRESKTPGGIDRAEDVAKVMEKYSSTGAKNLSKQSASTRTAELRRIEAGIGLTGEERAKFEKSLLHPGGGWSKDWESKINAKIKEKTGVDRDLGGPVSGTTPKNFTDALSALASAAQRVVQLSPGSKDKANAGGNPTNSNYGAGGTATGIG